MREACDRFRRSLVDGNGSGEHADSCSACQAFVHKWNGIEEALRSESGVIPTRDFAARVRSRLPQQAHPVATMALRTLPATLALLAVLSIWVAVVDRAPGDEDGVASTDDYVAWVLQDVAGEESE